MNESSESVASNEDAQKVRLIRESIEVSGSIGARVKYTSIDSCSIYFSVSQTSQSNNVYVILGANTGSIYFYEYISKTNSLKLISLLSNKEIRDSISLLKSNSYGSLLAISTTKNSLLLLEHNLIQYHINRTTSSINETGKEKHNILTKIPVKDEITCMIWNEDNHSTKEGRGTILYIGDSVGSVFAVNYFESISTSSTKKNMIEHLYKCDSPIVQLEYRDNKLLISSHSRSTIIDFQKHTCYQVGSQLRDGIYGSCFCDRLELDESEIPSDPNTPQETAMRVLAGRPGKRIWLADSSDGRVLQTLNFKESLSLLPIPSNFMDDSSKDKKEEEYDEILKSSTFAKLESIRSPAKSQTKFVISWDSNSNTIFLIDILNVKVLNWYADLSDISDATICYHWGMKKEQDAYYPLVFSVFFLHANLKSISKISLLPNIYSPNYSISLSPNLSASSNVLDSSTVTSFNPSSDAPATSSTPPTAPIPLESMEDVNKGISNQISSSQEVPSNSVVDPPSPLHSSGSPSSSLTSSMNGIADTEQAVSAPSSPRDRTEYLDQTPTVERREQRVAEITEEVNKIETQEAVASVTPTATIVTSASTSISSKSNTKSKRKKRTPVIPTLSTNSFPASLVPIASSSSANIPLHSSIGSNSISSDSSDFKTPSRSASTNDDSSGTLSTSPADLPSLSKQNSANATSTPSVFPLKLKDSVSKDITNSLKGVLNKTKTKSLDEFKQLKNLIKEVTNTSSPATSTNSPKVADLSSHSSVAAEEKGEKENINGVTPDVQSNPFYQLSKTAYEALVTYRRDSEKQFSSSIFTDLSNSSSSRSLLSLLALIDHWLTTFAVSQTMMGGVPSYWITEIITNYFELKISKEAASLSRYSTNLNSSNSTLYHWSDQEASKFIDKYFEWMNLHRIFFACNQSMLVHSTRLLLDKENSLFNEYAPLLQDTSQSQTPAIVKNMIHFNVVKEDYSVKIAVDKCMKEGDISGAFSLIKKINSIGAGKAIKESIFLRFIPYLFSADAIGSARMCAPFYPSILPWNVYSSLCSCLVSSPAENVFTTEDIIINTLYDNLRNPNSKRDETKDINKWREMANVYLQYLIILMNNFPICRNDSNLIHSLFEYCLLDSVQDSNISYVDDHLKFERGAHLKKYKHEDTLLTILGVTPSPSDEITEEKTPREKLKKGKKNQSGELFPLSSNSNSGAKRRKFE